MRGECGKVSSSNRMIGMLPTCTAPSSSMAGSLPPSTKRVYHDGFSPKAFRLSLTTRYGMLWQRGRAAVAAVTTVVTMMAAAAPAGFG